MILIISSEEDVSTIRVIDWLRFYKVEFLRISANDLVKIDLINFSNSDDLEFSIRNRKFKLSDFYVIWYRRSWLTMNFEKFSGTSSNDLNDSISNQLFSEQKIILDFVLNRMKKKSLNTQMDNGLSKLEILYFSLETRKLRLGAQRLKDQ
jgi:hypothetical protein